MPDTIEIVNLLLFGPMLVDEVTGERFIVTGVSADDKPLLTSLDRELPEAMRCETLKGFRIEARPADER